MEIEHIIGQGNIPRAVQSIVATTIASSSSSGNNNGGDYNNNSISNLNASAVCPPAARYVSAAGGCLVVNSFASPHEQTFLHATDGPLSSLRVSRSGRFIVSGHCGRNADVVLWDASGNNNRPFRLVMTFHEHERSVVDCAITDDDSIVVSIGAEKRLCFVDASNGALIAHMPMNGHVPDFQGPTAAPNCPYTTILAAGPRVQDTKRRQLGLFHTAVVTPNAVSLLHLDPYRGQVGFSVQPSQMRSQLSSFLKTFSAAEFTPFGDLLVLGTESGELALMNTENGAILQTIRACTLGVRSLSVVSTGDMGSPPQQQQNGGNTNNDFRYANFGQGSLRSSAIYIGGGDGSIVEVRLPSHQQPNQLSIAAKTSVGEPIATLSIISTNGSGAASSNVPSAKVLAQSISGAVFTVDVLDTQQKVPEHDMYNKRHANGHMPTYGGTAGDGLSAQQQRSNQFRNTQSMVANTTFNSTTNNNGFGGGGRGNNNNFNNTNSNVGGFSGGTFNGNSDELMASVDGPGAGANVRRIADAARSPFTALTPHPTDPARFFTASADGALREWDLNNYLCSGTFEPDTISHGVLGKGSAAGPSFANNQNPSGRNFIHSTGAGGGSGFGNTANVGSRHQNAIGGAAGGAAGAGGYKVGAAAVGTTGGGGAQCTMLKIAAALDLLLSAWSDGSIRCHDLTDRSLLWTHQQAHKCPITALCATTSLRYFATGGADGEIKLWDTKTRELRGSAPQAHQQAVTHLEFFEANGGSSGGGSGGLAAAPSSYGIGSRGGSGYGGNNTYGNTNNGGGNGGGEEQYLLSAGRDRTVCTWEIGVGFSSLRRQTSHQTHAGPLNACKLSARGPSAQAHFYSIGVDRKIHVCDLRNNREPIHVVDYNALPSTLASSSSSSSADAAHSAVGMLARLRSSIDSYASCFAFTSDERFVVTGGSDAVVKLWNMQNFFEPIAMAAGHSDLITGIAFTCDQKQIVSVGNDGTIVVWNNYF